MSFASMASLWGPFQALSDRDLDGALLDAWETHVAPVRTQNAAIGTGVVEGDHEMCFTCTETDRALALVGFWIGLGRHLWAREMVSRRVDFKQQRTPRADWFNCSLAAPSRFYSAPRSRPGVWMGSMKSRSMHGAMERLSNRAFRTYRAGS